MDLVFELTALRQLRDIPKADAARIRAALQEIADTHPQRMPYATELAGSPTLWRARKGDYRAIYAITDKAIIVTEIGHRKDIYR
jgi:mRNA-degrading endonuclease RelE of RelBE toxin-antitoxin system